MKKLFGLVVVLSFFVIIPSVWAGVPPSDCCFANGGTGCEDPTCEATVCGVDPFCCDVAWDGICAGEANDLCAICMSSVDPCTEAQIAAQNAVENGGPYRNHGKLVKTAAHAANQFDISEECHSCIVSQFARRIPREEQEVCTESVMQEGEACGDDTNGGCNSAPPEFGAIACGQTVAGTAWADSGFRDTDWYLIDLPANGTGYEMVTATLVSNFEGVNFVLDIAYPACDIVDPIVGTIGCSNDGVPIQDASATLTVPGTYVIFVAPGMCNGGAIFEGIPCDGAENNYTVSVECSEVAAP